MDRNADSLDKPLLLNQQESSYDDDESEFYDAFSSIRNSAKSATAALSSSISQPNSGGVPAASSAPEGAMPATSYYGKVSPLSTGMLFPSSRGIVDTLPHPNKPCFMFADHDPLAAIAHICLLEKEAETMPAGQLPTHTTLFTVVHVCEPLSNHEDAGMRILKKIQKKGMLKLPVLLHNENILQETGGGRSSLSLCLLPEYIDEAIGTKNLLRPSDPVGLYNMKLFIQRHSQLPTLFHQLLTNTSPTHRIQLSTQLLGLLKLVNADLQKFAGPYLCGKQFTLADIYIFPMVERIVAVLSPYRSFWIPPALTYLINWYDTVSDRPAVRVATSDRTVESQNTYCYERVRRNEYLIEVYECYARNEEGLFRELNDARGCPGVNIYRQVVEDEMNDKKTMCEGKACKHCIIS